MPHVDRAVTMTVTRGPDALRNLIMHSKSGLEQSTQLWLQEAADSRGDLEKKEVSPETLRWQPAAFRFRLVGITDMRGDSNASEKPVPPMPNLPNQSRVIERRNEC
jgi:hypothetical protein